MANLYLLMYGGLLLLDGIAGQQFLDKYQGAIQNNIMTGHEGGWGQHCDILSDSTHSHKGIPQITMALDKIKLLNPKTAFSSSKCLLVTYDVSSKYELSALLNFGHAAIYHVRLALVVKLHSGITLGMATNASKLPYLVAAETSLGKEEFLCPVVGKPEPRLQEDFCKPSYISYKYKTLRIALMGVMPNVIMTEHGPIDGTNIRLLKMLEQRLGFSTEVIFPPSLIGALSMVCNLS